jgi:hypothetical protein
MQRANRSLRVRESVGLFESQLWRSYASNHLNGVLNLLQAIRWFLRVWASAVRTFLDSRHPSISAEGGVFRLHCHEKFKDRVLNLWPVFHPNFAYRQRSEKLGLYHIPIFKFGTSVSS